MADPASSSTNSALASIAVRGEPTLTATDAAGWDALDHGPSPFLRAGFLRALEESKSIGGRSGWTPVYLLAEQGGKLVGGVAVFAKSHSYGEYIFDWGWANAAERAGISYYPKLVIAAPMTPATGARILLAPALAGRDRDTVTAALIGAVRAIADEVGASSIHWLFCTAGERDRLAAAGYIPRTTHQFHWRNRGYHTFDDFLGQLKSRKRKQLRKERSKAKAAIEKLEWLEGAALDRAALDDLDRFYRSTTDQHGGHDYLKPGFFHRVAKLLPEATRMVSVTVGGKRIAGALFFETAHGLYGRYWGADERVDLLHFETAYYAGIDRAIANGLPLFEAGAQGEHKLLRGFEPSETYSAHWIRHPGLAHAIADACARETAAVKAQIVEMAAYGPYRSDSDADGDE